MCGKLSILRSWSSAWSYVAALRQKGRSGLSPPVHEFRCCHAQGVRQANECAQAGVHGAPGLDYHFVIGRARKQGMFGVVGGHTHLSIR